MKKITIVMLLLAWSLQSIAQPTAITWQGKLIDAGGNAITQNNVAMTFAMFDASTGGNQLWPASGVVTKTVDVVQGLYFVPLGTGTGDDIAFTAAMFDGKTPWLEVKVGTETLPRTEITNVPFALISNDLSATGWENPGEIGKTTPNTGKFTSVETASVKITSGASDGKVLTSDAAGNASWESPSIVETDPVFGVSAAKGITSTDITNWNSKISSQWTTSGSNIYYNSGNVGIGTSIPTQKLHVNGSMLLPTGSSYWIGNAADAGNRLRLHQSGTSAYIDWGEDDLFFRSGAATVNNRVVFSRDGKVGIGTTAPKAALDLGNTVTNRKIALFVSADNDHQFTGFGLNNDALRFQLANTSGNYKFYGATSATTSTELFRIQGNGQIVIPALSTAGVLTNNTSGLISSSIGISGQVLSTNGSGEISWITPDSWLSNVKCQIAYAGGNSSLVISSYNPYDPTLVKYAEITVPGPGIILTQATGYIGWKSKNDDYCRMCIISDDVATNTIAFGSNYFGYLMLNSDHNLADSIDEYNGFAYSRIFTINAAGTYRYNLWADKGYSYCYIEINDVNMQAIYFPTEGTGDSGTGSTGNGFQESTELPDYIDGLVNLDGSFSETLHAPIPDVNRTQSGHNYYKLLEDQLRDARMKIDSLFFLVRQIQTGIKEN